MKNQRCIYPLITLLLATTACRRTDDAGTWLKLDQEVKAPAVHLFDALGGASFEGLAAALVKEGIDGKRSPALAVDFEDGGLGPLSVYFGAGVPVTDAASRVVVSKAETSFAGQSVCLLGKDAPHGVSLRTAAIPVDPSTTWDLSYQVHGNDVRAASKTVYGGASIVMYKLPADPAEAAAILADEGREKLARVNDGKPPASFWTPNRYGDTPWVRDAARFFTAPEATHMVVSFDLARPEDDRQPIKNAGRICFDDIKLDRVQAPLHARYRELDQGTGEPHPLKMVLQLQQRGHKKATDQRYSLYAPAPSTLSFPVTVPAAAALSLGFALLPEAQAAGGGEVLFRVAVVGADGKRTVAWEQTRAWDETEYWAEADVDLSAWAGQSVTLRLETVGAVGEAGADPAVLPDAAAVWSYPVLHSRKSPGRTVVLVAFDTLPAKRTSTFGYTVETTPHMTRIAQLGVAFDRAVSPSPWTLGAFAALLTGYDPAHHRAGERQYGTQSWRRPLARDFWTLAERMRAAGWDTRAWINNPYLTREFGLDEGFSHFIDVGTRSIQEASAPLMASVSSQLEQPVGYDRLFFIHFMDPHGPYRPTKEFERFLTDTTYDGQLSKGMGGQQYLDMTQQKLKVTDEDKERVAHLFEGVIGYSDDLLGKLFDAFRRVSLPDRFAFIVTADHGEELWEHGLYEHGHQMFDELLRVPLIVYIPELTAKGARIRHAVSSHDINPTILSWAGLSLPADLDALPLQPWLGGEEPPADRILFGHQMLYGNQRMSVERGGWKLLYNQANTDFPEGRAPNRKVRYELYDLSQDPGEQTNRHDKQVARTRELLELLSEGFVRSLAGHYVVYFDGGEGDKAHRVVGTLRQQQEGSWLRFSKDLLWPLANGRAGTLDVRFPRKSDHSEALFDVMTPRGLLAFSLDKGVGPVEIALTVDGAPLDVSQLQLGSGKVAAPSLPFTPTDADLALPAKALLSPNTTGKPRIVVALLDESPELVGERERAVSDDVSEQLKALGYTDD